MQHEVTTENTLFTMKLQYLGTKHETTRHNKKQNFITGTNSIKLTELKSYRQTVLVAYETNKTLTYITNQPLQMNFSHTDMQDRKLSIHQPPVY